MLLISGRVQGVGFRWFAVREARARDVWGYARNLEDGRVEVLAQAAPETLWQLMVPTSTSEWLARAALIGIGASAGFFVVPLAVFMQARPPKDQKGRIIGAMNLVNWIGIVFSALFFQVAQQCLSVLP